ncbi:MAG: helix-turn-helix domain-containing protein [Candidatus Ornithomonoglobus sp.]
MLANLKLLRTSRNISQQRLGAAIGVSQQSINKYENHNIEPDIHTLMLLADYFNTSIDYLVGYTDIDHKIEHVYNTDMSKKEYEHMRLYRMLNNKEKQSIELIIENYIDNKT